MLKMIIGIGGETPLNSNVPIKMTFNRAKVFGYSFYWEAPIDTGTGIGMRPNILSVYNKSIVFNNPTTISPSIVSKIIIAIDGNFNYDEIGISTPENVLNRVEVRNENDVLIIDNGLPWGDGTYPPDAKNRAGLSGLHASPAVINPELETALMGDETNNERVQE